MRIWLTVIWLAVRALVAYKARSLLTMLGIIIGIAAVIIMINVGRGASAGVQQQIQSLGADMLMVFPGSSRRQGVRGGSGSQPTLRVRDAEAIARECASVLRTTHLTVRTAQLVAGENNWNTTVAGTTADYPLIRDWTVARGAFFSPHHGRTAARVAVLGESVRKNFFGPHEEAIGKDHPDQQCAFPHHRHPGRQGKRSARQGPGRHRLCPLPNL